MSAELAHDGTEPAHIEAEPPEVMTRNLTAAGYLLAGATAFFFVAFLFGFFYLRSLNNAGMWKPSGVGGSIGWGTAVVACYVVSALLVRLGLADHVAGRQAAWRLKGLIALLAGLAGLIVQVFAWTHEGFGPADGGYASIYFGWTAFLFLFVIGAMFWLETTLATSYRYRNASPESSGHDISDPVSLVRGELVALSFYWMFLAGIAVVTWIVLYLV
jgi:heme/copper-type cytochrome/quinol oxidase subunit 3